MIRIALLTIAALVALTACGGDDDEGDSPLDQEPTATPGGPTPEGTTSPTAATTLPEITSLCDLVTQEDVEEALGESVTGASEFRDVSCAYSTASGGVSIERGSQDNFELGIYRTGDLGEPVSGIGDEAAWYVQGVGGLNILIVHKGDFYFQIRLRPELDSAAQLEIAKDIATKAVERLP